METTKIRGLTLLVLPTNLWWREMLEVQSVIDGLWLNQLFIRNKASIETQKDRFREHPSWWTRMHHMLGRWYTPNSTGIEAPLLVTLQISPYVSLHLAVYLYSLISLIITNSLVSKLFFCILWVVLQVNSACSIYKFNLEPVTGSDVQVTIWTGN